MRLISLLGTANLLLIQPQISNAFFTIINPSECNGVRSKILGSSECSNPASQIWRQLADKLIRRVWSSSQILVDDEAALSFAGENIVEASVSSRYGGEIVLRFSISTEEEAQALHEASNTLFLDIWEVKENWVDIRLAKDVVNVISINC